MKIELDNDHKTRIRKMSREVARIYLDVIEDNDVDKNDGPAIDYVCNLIEQAFTYHFAEELAKEVKENENSNMR